MDGSGRTYWFCAVYGSIFAGINSLVQQICLQTTKINLSLCQSLIIQISIPSCRWLPVSGILLVYM